MAKKNKKSKNTVKLSRTALSLLCCSILPGTLSAADVTNGSDSGPGSMREAITNASPNETINFDPDLTINVGNTINVTQPNITLDGNRSVRFEQSLGLDPAVNFASTVASENMAGTLPGRWDAVTKYLDNGYAAGLDSALSTIGVDYTLPDLTIITSSSRTNAIIRSTGGAGNGLTLNNLNFNSLGTFPDGNSAYFEGVVSVINTSNGNATLGNVTDVRFSSSTIQVSNNTEHALRGGGLVSVYSNVSDATVQAGDFTRVVFDNNKVSTTIGNIHGGGFIGAAGWQAGSNVSIGRISDSLFITNDNGSPGTPTVSSANNLNGGGIVGAYAGAGGTATIKGIEDSRFSGLSVETTVGSINGGGMIGANAASRGKATIEEGVRGSRFDGLSVTAGGTISGGGLVGAYAGERGESKVGAIQGSLFNDVKIEGKGPGNGGGLIGAGVSGNSNAAVVATGKAEVGNVSDSLFSKIDVSFTGNMQGGGLVGSYVGSLANGSGTSTVGSITGVVMDDIKIRTSLLAGGGLIGAFGGSGVEANIGDVTNSIFRTIDVETIEPSASYIRGGGLIGASAGTGKDASLGRLDTVIFDGVTVKPLEAINGGGLVGIVGSGSSTSMGGVSNVLFKDTNVTVGTDIVGGGLVGGIQRGVGGAVHLGQIDSVATRGDTVITTGNNLTGGGLFGVGASNGAGGRATAAGLSNADIQNVTVSIGEAEAGTGRIRGGGIFGVYAGTNGNAAMGDVSNAMSAVSKSAFRNISVTASYTGGDTTLQGGGVIGVTALGGGTGYNAELGTISNNLFDGITVGTSRGLRGGGVVGIFSDSTGSGRMGDLENNTFRDINVTVDHKELFGDLYGGGVVGIMGTQGRADMGSVVNSSFSGITVDINRHIRGSGVVGVSGRGANIGAVDNVSFEGINITAGQYLTGGGLLGAYSGNSNSKLESLKNAGFSDINITTGQHIYGGGLVGSEGNGTLAEIGEVNNVSFRGINVTSGTSLVGGGLVGNYQAGLGGIARLGQIDTIAVGGEKIEDKVVIKAANEIYGGGIFGVGVASNQGGPGGQATAAGLSNVGVQNVEVSAGTGRIQGGGIFGAYSGTDGTATMGDVFKSSFQHLNITAGYTAGDTALRGGGVIGVTALGGGANIADINGKLGNVTENLFDTIKIETGSGLRGGGIVGIFSDSTGSGEMGGLEGNAFNEINVNVKTNDLYGGGVVGVMGTQGRAIIDFLTNNSFTGITVDVAKHIRGSGVVGVSGASARISNVDKVWFEDINITAGDYLTGAGLLGAYSGNSDAEITSITNAGFSNITINTGNNLYGGGAIGVYSGTTGSGTLGAMNAISIDKLTVNSEGAIYGGGAIGVHSDDQPASMGKISEAVFKDIRIDAVGTIPTGIAGGGVVGVYAAGSNNTASLDGLDTVAFDQITVNLDTSTLYGGGVIGASAGANGQATIGEISESIFSNLNVQAGGTIAGGGIIGSQARAGGLAEIAAITNSTFHDIEVSGATVHGGVIGASVTDSAGSSSLAGINGSYFEKINVTAESGDVYGGVVYSGGLNEKMVISDSVFANTSVTAGNYAYGGVVGIDTSRATANQNGHHLEVKAGSGKQTVFYNNSVSDSRGQRSNSIHIGNIGGDNSAGDAKLDLMADAGGLLALYTPVSVSMNNGRNFDMTVGGGGDILWGGINRFAVSDSGRALVTFNSGSTTRLMSDFQINNEFDGQTGELNIHFEDGTLLTFDDLGNRDKEYAFFAREGNESVTVTGVANVRAESRLTFDPSYWANNRWLVALTSGENAVNVSDANFNSIVDGIFGLSFIQEADGLYLKHTIDNLTDNPNENVENNYESGNLEDEWDRVVNDDVPGQDGIFDNIVRNPQTYTPEAALTSNFIPLDYTTALNERIQSLAYLNGCQELCGERWRLWADYNGGDFNQHNSGGFYGYDASYNGVTIGGSTDFGLNSGMGVYFSYGDIDADFQGLRSKVNFDAITGGIYAYHRPIEPLTLLVDSSFGYFNTSFTREDAFGKHESDYDQTVFSLGGKGIYDYQPDAYSHIKPFVGIRYQQLRQSSFTESGDYFASWVEKNSANSLASSLGFELSREVNLDSGKQIVPSLRAAWRHEFLDRQFDARTKYKYTASSGYKLKSIERDADSLDLGISVKARLLQADCSSLDLQAGYNLNLSQDYRGESWFAGLVVTF